MKRVAGMATWNTDIVGDVCWIPQINLWKKQKRKQTNKNLLGEDIDRGESIGGGEGIVMMAEIGNWDLGGGECAQSVSYACMKAV